MSGNYPVGRERKTMAEAWRGTWGRRFLWLFTITAQLGGYWHNLQVHSYLILPNGNGAEIIPAYLGWLLIVIEIAFYFGLTDTFGSWFYGWFNQFICWLRGCHVWRRVDVNVTGTLSQSYRVRCCLTCGKSEHLPVNSSGNYTTDS